MYFNKIFGLGLSKTATTSLAASLNMLGFHTKHFPSPVYFPHRFYGIKPHQLKKYDAFTDITVIPFYKKLDKLYPGSKFIYTVRDIDQWLESCRKYPRFNLPLYKLPFKIIKLRQIIYGTLKFDEQEFREAYHSHHEDVISYFSGREEDLLVVNLCEGKKWDPLCKFLNLEKPKKSFPHKYAAITNYDGHFKY